MAWGGEMFVQGQDSVMKELIRRFPTYDFFWINDIFSDEEDKNEEGEEQAEDNPTNRVFMDIVIENNIIETQEEEYEDVPPM